jgi:N4-gp56 family major capsid protein
MASEYTLKANLVIPEVIADLVEGKLGDNITLLPLATEDNTLVGQPGDTLKFPAFKYIGKATVIAENGQIETGKLEAGTTQATVHKYAKGISITDEARLSGHGDPMGEAAKQLARAIDQGVDDELFSVLNGVGVSRKHINTTISADNIADALVLFGEDLTGDKVLLTDAAGFAALRKDNDYIRASDLGQRMITDEIVGISIHAPRGGATVHGAADRPGWPISIHAPRGGSDKEECVITSRGCAPSPRFQTFYMTTE